MKKTIRIIIPILLVLAIVLCMAWYLFIYDRGFTRDVLLSCARYSESQGYHTVAATCYSLAYSQAADNDSVAIELANQYIKSGNYTKAEYTLSNAIADGGGVELYIALCKTYVQQDKLLDAVTMLDNITNTDVKATLTAMRPAAPTASPEPGFYSKYISVTLSSEAGTLYATSNGQYPSTEKNQYTEAITLHDGENTIYALSVDDNGLVSPLSIFGYTVGGVVEVMEFSDAAVEQEVRTLLNVEADAVLYTNDLWTITAFTMPAEAKVYSDLRHMTFLESLTIEKGIATELANVAPLANLTELTIRSTSVSQEALAVIGALPQLKTLTLEACNLSSIKPLENAKGIISLNLANNAIRNIDALSSMKGLQELNLQRNTVDSLSAISGAFELKTLDVSFNALTSIAPLCTLTSLTRMDASNNVITELGDMGKLTSLKHLILENNNLTTVGKLAECTSLTELNIASNALTDISTLAALTNMQYLNFAKNQVTEIPEFPKDCALVTIDGSNNLISSLDRLSGLQQLNIVNMDYNTEIASVAPLADCPCLIEVNVYATKVTEVSMLTNQSIIVNFKPV